MPRKISIICLVCIVLLCAIGGYSKAEDDISEHRSCKYCGMDRKAFGYSRMVVVFADGASVGVCSIHCAATALKAAGDRKVRTLLVADRSTREMINAKDAFWIIGGKKKGVMTHRPKWAFATKTGAEAFIAAYGGVLADWDSAFAAAREDAEPLSSR
jgi:nitrous oxide reductase accessory protein NosL